MPRVLELLIVVLTVPLWGTAWCLVAVLLEFSFGFRGGIYFRQERPGLHGRPFRILKFRTMREGTEPDEVRVTRVGKFLRATSLDELPEMWNVLKGEMALVGPRPLLMRYLETYTPEEHHRHDVRPGVTGWAQIHGRNAITLAEKVQYDLWYVAHRSLWLDVKILFLTVFHLRGN